MGKGPKRCFIERIFDHRDQKHGICHFSGWGHMVFGGHKEVSSNWPGFGPISAIIQVVPPMPLAY